MGTHDWDNGWGTINVRPQVVEPYQNIRIWGKTGGGLIAPTYALITDGTEIDRAEGDKIHDYWDPEYAFEFNIGAPAVPGPYTYWIIYGPTGAKSPPFGIDVVRPSPPPTPSETAKKLLLLGTTGALVGGLVWYLVRE